VLFSFCFPLALPRRAALHLLLLSLLPHRAQLE
jgi:hypothetical protein